MNRILLVVFGILLIAIGIIGRIYFNHYEGTLIPNPELFLIVSYLCIFLGVFLFYRSSKLKLRNIQAKAQTDANKLKQNGEKINVPLHQCDIKEGDYCVIIFSYNNPRTGAPEIFVSPPINRDKVTLTFYLEKQKNIFVYVDKSDRSKYYFDLEFLSK